MKRSNGKKTYRKATRILLMPILAIFFLVGWGLYSTGRKDTKQPKKLTNNINTSQNEELKLTVIPREEQTIAV